MNKKILIIGDVHTENTAIEELQEIFKEIFYSQKEKIKQIIFLGDVFHKKTPSNQELDFVTGLLCDMQMHCPVVIVTGNHEETTSTLSAIDYTRHFGITLLRHHGKIQIGNKNLYLGHHFVDTDDEYIKDEKFITSELSKTYDLCLLGHNHQYKEHAKNVICLGSIRRVSFAEVEYGMPKYAFLVPESLEIEPYEVKSAIPMIDVNSFDKALKTNPRAKLRLIIESFEEYLRILNKLPELEQKFHTFRVKHDYSQQVTSKVKKEIQKKGKSFEEIFNKFLTERVKNNKVRQFIKENL